MMAAYLLAITLVVVASLMYLVENRAQPVAFANIPSAMWWGLVTLTTVGYGDVTPVTVAGQAVLIVHTAIGYLGLGALLSILATKFASRGN